MISRCGFDDRADVSGVNRFVTPDESGPTSHKYSVSVRWPQCPLFQGDMTVSIFMGGIRGVLSNRNARPASYSNVRTEALRASHSIHSAQYTRTIPADLPGFRFELSRSTFFRSNNPCLTSTLFGGSPLWKHK